MTGFLKFICGGRYSSFALFISMIVGLTFGLPSHSMQLFSFCALLVFLFLKLSLRLVLLSGLVAWVLALLVLDPALHSFGQWILNLAPSFWGSLSNIPIVSWFRFSNTMVIGPIVAILLLSPVVYFKAKLIKNMIGQPTKGDFRLVRLKITLPVVTTAILSVIYLLFFLDLHLKWTLKKAMEFATGAEVNIASLTTSMRESSLIIHDIQLTDADDPTKNALALDKIKFDIAFSQLLRGKVVIENSAIEGLSFGGERKAPGWVKPKPAPTVKDTAPNPEVERMKAQGMEAFSRLQDMAKGLDPTAELRKMKPEDFPSAQKIAEIRGQLSSGKESWQKSIDSLPKSEVLKAKVAQIKAVKPPTNLEDINRFRDELEKIKSETKADIEKVNVAYDNISKNVEGLSKSVSEMGDLVKGDLGFVMGALKLPQVDAKSLAKDLLEPIIGKYVSKAISYYNILAPYLKSEGEKKPAKPLRLAGLNREFPSNDGIPGFWWKKAVLSWKGHEGLSGSDQVSGSDQISGSDKVSASSGSSDSEKSSSTAVHPAATASEQHVEDHLKGELLDLCSSQDICVKPFKLLAQGSLKSAELTGLKFEFDSDHRGTSEKDSIGLSISEFSSPGITLSEAANLKLAMGSSKGSLDFKFVKTNDLLDIGVKLGLHLIKWDFAAENELAKKILTTAASRLSSLSVEATAKKDSEGKDLVWELTSNLTKEIEASFKEVVDKELGAAKAKIEKELQSRIAAEKKKMEAELTKVKTEVLAQVNAKKAEAKAILDELENRKKEAQSKFDAITNEARAKLEAEKARLDAEKNKQVDSAKSKAKDALKSKLPFKK